MSEELNRLREVLRAVNACLEAATPHIREDGHASGLMFVPADRINWLRDAAASAQNGSLSQSTKEST